MKREDINSIIVAGCTLYLIGCIGLFTNWKTFQRIDAASSVTSGLGLLTICVGILLIDGYFLFKAFAFLCIVLIVAFGMSWILHLPAL